MTTIWNFSPVVVGSVPLLAGTLSLTVFGAAIATAAVLCRTSVVAANLTDERGRAGCLDGLRGLLAVGVMTHHTYCAFNYFTSGNWTTRESVLLGQLGGVTVALFFMITGLLFTDRALAPRIDWVALYASRGARLTPLYAVVVMGVFISAMSLTNWQTREPIPEIGAELVQWLAFVAFGSPDINGLTDTSKIIAGVNWTLKCEWIFYLFAVPAIYACARIAGRVGFGRILSLTLIVVLLVCISFGHQHHGGFLIYSYFLCGMVAAVWIKIPQLSSLFSTTAFRAIAALSALVLLSIPLPFDGVELTLIFMVFLAVAGGLSWERSMFGRSFGSVMLAMVSTSCTAFAFFGRIGR